MKIIPFFSDDITIKAHSATSAEHLNKPIPIRVFAKGKPCSLYELDNGELQARLMDGSFIEGPEVG